MSAPELSGQEPQNVLAALLATALNAPGRKEFRLVVADGHVVELAEAAVRPAAAAEPAHLTMMEAAKFIHKNYFWLSKHWKREGLHRIGKTRPYLFERKELEEYLRRQRFSYRGRPRTGALP